MPPPCLIQQGMTYPPRTGPRLSRFHRTFTHGACGATTGLSADRLLVFAAFDRHRERESVLRTALHARGIHATMTDHTGLTPPSLVSAPVSRLHPAHTTPPTLPRPPHPKHATPRDRKRSFRPLQARDSYLIIRPRSHPNASPSARPAHRNVQFSRLSGRYSPRQPAWPVRLLKRV